MRDARARRGLPIATLAPPLLVFILVVDALAVGWSGFALSKIDSDAHTWAVLALLAALAIGFEEGASRSARLQLRLGSELKQDMTSVWSVAAAVALPPWAAVLLLTTVLGHVWFRQQRPAGEALYRRSYTAASVVLGCLCATSAIHSWSHMWGHLPWALAGSISVLVVIVIDTTINRSLITVALVGVGVRGRTLLGTRDENLTEFATLCLGGLVAIAAGYEPWLCILAIAPMVSLQRGALVRELELAANTDPKTGLLNAVAWELVAGREVARASRERHPLAVLIMDIDRFKLVNDTHGHLVGDIVLRGIGRCLTSTMRDYDTVGRFGGEEFVAVLPSADESTALIVAERVRSRVNQLRVGEFIDRPADRDDTLAVSIGVACFPIDGQGVADLLRSADQALYQAKAVGRNRVQLAERGGGLPDVVVVP